ncbi:hypothetical protein QIT38_gp11 [Methanocaldococcus fervens tailed virus 1]|uniref:Phage-like element PBSX protein XkdF domain-containing protein n=2 Tax=root TaxID=1 RepID=C7P5H3_METFA|nr:hypothetical protein [Methanocaldococcus fervens]YP_010772306.1 hypothetical protein QIT38_gp11 [Methanocaldococcus fervens tailed virus 1]ACV25351.1 hypothetical protein Mefer_1548 [Methanocaldococcus fervens AG86]QNO11481.1 hypothetical protein [Methanocaldococcus fervens tailed virus 1]
MQIWMKVLEPTTIDGREITKDFIMQYAPTLKGKPVNIDHNYFNASNTAVGEVKQVAVNPETGELYALLEIFDDVYNQIKDELKGASIEWNANPSGDTGMFRAVALCVNTVPKVPTTMGTQAEVVAASPSHKSKMEVVDGNWDKTKAIQALRKWASSDGSGDKDKIDWDKYKLGFAYYDPNKKEDFGSYKFPHHTVVNGKLVLHKQGLFTAMAYVNGAMGATIPENVRKEVYKHLREHYKRDLGMKSDEVPEFKASEKLEQELIEKVKKAVVEDLKKDMPEIMASALKKQLPELLASIKEVKKEQNETKEVKEINASEICEKLNNIEALLKTIVKKQLNSSEISASKPPSGKGKPDVYENGVIIDL